MQNANADDGAWRRVKPSVCAGRRLTHDGVCAIGGGRAGGRAVVVGCAAATAAATAAAAPASSVEAGHGRKAGADVCRRVRGVTLQRHKKTHVKFTSSSRRVHVYVWRPSLLLGNKLNQIGPDGLISATHFLRVCGLSINVFLALAVIVSKKMLLHMIFQAVLTFFKRLLCTVYSFSICYIFFPYSWWYLFIFINSLKAELLYI